MDVFLFEVFEAGNYIFQGQVTLSEDPYQEDQPDINGNLRKVWIFPLKITDQAKTKPLPESIIIKKQEKKIKEARRLSDAELEKRAKYSKKGVRIPGFTGCIEKYGIALGHFLILSSMGYRYNIGR